jgi:tetratricopeptide (TPR) repeat protein
VAKSRILDAGVALGIALGLAPFARAQAPGGATACAEPAPAVRDEARLLYEKGRALLLSEQWAEAAAELEAAVRLDPTLALAHYGVGEAWLALKMHPEAVAAFLDCRAAFRCLLASPEAVARFDRLRKQEEGLIRTAIAQLEKDRGLRFAIKQKEANRTPEPAPGEVARQIQALEDRLDAVQKARGRPPMEPPELAFALGNAYFQAGSPYEAERELRAALAARPGWGDVHHNLAVVLMVAGRLEEAEAEMKKAERAGVPAHPRLREEIGKRAAGVSPP